MHSTCGNSCTVGSGGLVDIVILSPADAGPRDSVSARNSSNIGDRTDDSCSRRGTFLAVEINCGYTVGIINCACGESGSNGLASRSRNGRTEGYCGNSPIIGRNEG